MKGWMTIVTEQDIEEEASLYHLRKSTREEDATHCLHKREETRITFKSDLKLLC